MAQNLLTPSNARYNLDLVVTLILNVRHITVAIGDVSHAVVL